jgi:hypothetical protein
MVVKSIINGVTTYYVGRHYHKEVDGSDSTVKKYYTAASTTIAVRTIVNGTDDTLNWLLADHLGSTTLATFSRHRRHRRSRRQLVLRYPRTEGDCALRRNPLVLGHHPD